MEWSALHLKARLDDIEHGHKLGEDEHLVTFFTELIEQVKQSIHLGTLFLEEFRVDQTRVTTNLT